MAKFKLEDKLNPLFSEPTEPEQEAAATTEKRRRGRPQKDDLVRGNSVQEGLTVEYTRATFIMRVDLLEKLKDYAYTERISNKDAINKLLSEALEREEKRLAKDGVEIISKGGK